MKATIVTAALVFGLAGFCAAQEDPERRFQDALRVEEGEGARAGLARWEALAADASAPAVLRARALLRAGAARERLGDLEGARTAWQRVVADHAALVEAVAEARGALARLADKVAAASAPPAVIRIEPGAPGPGGGARLSVSVQDGSVRDVLCGLARAAGLNLLVGPEVRGVVNVTLRDIDGEEALRTIAESTGDYALVRDATGALLRVNSRQLLEEQLELRAYRLAGSQLPGPEAVERWRPALATARALLDRSKVRGAMVELDPASRTVFVWAAPQQLDAVREAFGGLLVAPAAATGGARVSLEVVDANLRSALELVAGSAGRPLIIAPAVRGIVSAVVRDVPAQLLLAQLARCGGRYVVVETPAGDLVHALGALEDWLVLEAWPLAPEPAAFWTAGGWTVERTEAGPRHPIERVVERLLDARSVRGTRAGLDPVGHALVLRATPHDLAQLHAALEVAGYVAPVTAAPAGELGRLAPDTNVRVAIEQVAAGQTNVVVAPNVRGNLDGTWRKAAPLLDVLRLFATAVGDFQVQGGSVVRVLTRDHAESKLETRRLVSQRRGAGLDPLARLLEQVVDAAGVQGASLLHAAGSEVLLASLPGGLLDEVDAVLRVIDAPGRLAANREVLACVTWRGPKELEGGLWELGPSGFQQVTDRPDGSTLSVRFVGPFDARLVVTGPGARAEVPRGRWPTSDK